jgi:hypothetical protein
MPPTIIVTVGRLVDADALDPEPAAELDELLLAPVFAASLAHADNARADTTAAAAIILWRTVNLRDMGSPVHSAK